MKKDNPKNLYIGIVGILAFVLWTITIQCADLQAIGPNRSVVGFGTLNRYIQNLFGVHMTLYVITDWLGLVPIAFAFGFAILGLIQWIKRKRILKVDFSILILGGFYLIVMAVYILFEYVVVNYRPVLINGYLEASYPSSTTMLVMCVMPTAITQLRSRIKKNGLKMMVTLLISAFIAFMVLGRLASGVHWFTDILGGAFVSTGLVALYRFVCNLKV